MIPKVILFDFDGVILDSMKVRDIGFRKIFSSYPPNLVEKLIQYHNHNGGLSRYHKIEYFYKKLLNKSITNKQIKEYANKFSEIMKKELTKEKYIIKETLNFIEKNYTNYDLHIVSGSDEKELNYLCKEHNISKYFKSIKGSPTKKNILIQDIIKENHYDKKYCILIGDSINDYDAANFNHISFYGYNNKDIIKLSKIYIFTFDELDLNI